MSEVIQGVIESCVKDGERRIETPEVNEEIAKCGKEALGIVDYTNGNLQKVIKSQSLSGQGKAKELEAERQKGLGKIENKRSKYTFEGGIGQLKGKINSEEHFEQEELLKSKDATTMWLQYKEVRDYFNSLDHRTRVNTLLRAGEKGDNDELIRALLASPVPLPEGIDNILQEAQELAIQRKYPEQWKLLKEYELAAAICDRICELSHRSILSLRGEKRSV